MYDRDDQPPTEGGWMSNLSPAQQLGYGCLVIVIIGAMTMYCVGTLSFIVRPMIVQRSTPTELVRPTLVATPTQAAPTFINLPPGTLLATPTQAPIPTREPTMTPTVDLTNPAPAETLSGSPFPNGTLIPGAQPSRSPTRRTPTLAAP
jgi:hypothetical protein